MSIPWAIGAVAATLAAIASACKRDNSAQEMDGDSFKDYINAMYNPDPSPDYKYDKYLNENEERGYKNMFSWSDRWFLNQNSLLEKAKEKLIENIENKGLIFAKPDRHCQYNRMGNTHVFSCSHRSIELPLLYENNTEMEVAKNPEKYVFCIEGHNAMSEIKARLLNMDLIKSIALMEGKKTDYDTLKDLQRSFQQTFSKTYYPVEYWFLERVSKTLNVPTEDPAPPPGLELFAMAAEAEKISTEDMIAAYFIWFWFGGITNFSLSDSGTIERTALTFSLSHEGIYPNEVLEFTNRYIKKFETFESLDKDILIKGKYMLDVFNMSIELNFYKLKKKYPDKTFVIYVGKAHLPAVEAIFGN